MSLTNRPKITIPLGKTDDKWDSGVFPTPNPVQVGTKELTPPMTGTPIAPSIFDFTRKIVAFFNHWKNLDSPYQELLSELKYRRSYSQVKKFGPLISGP